MSRRPVALLLAVLAVVAVACGDDEPASPVQSGARPVDTTAADESAPATTTSSTTSTTTVPLGTGSGELVVEGTTYAFTLEACSFAPVTVDGEDHQVWAQGAGELDGRAFTVLLSRQEQATGSTFDSLQIEVSPTERATITGIHREGSGQPTFTVADGVLTASADVLTSGGLPGGPATLTATCDA